MIKNLFSLFALLLLGGGVFAQTTIGESQYDLLKQNGQLSSGTHYQIIPSIPTPPLLSGVTRSATSTTNGGSDCGCYSDPDTSYTLAMTPNDDGSTA